MQYCKRCVIPSSRPGITFDAEGICHPCRTVESFENIDWDERRKQLQEIAEWGRKHSNGEYDCLIGVSGGKDSTRQAMYARDELGLRPLLVSCTYPPQQQSVIGARNIANLIDLGFDTLIVGPGPEKWKEMMKRGFIQFGNWAKPTEMALYAIPARVAIAYKIPLILHGENNAIMSGDVGGTTDGNANKIKYNNTLGGGDPEAFLGDGITRKDTILFTFPSDEEMARINMRMVYMGFYIKDFNPFVNADLAMENGLSIRDVEPEDIGALNIFEDLDEDFVHVNQMLKYFKLGFARATDDASQAIRFGRMTRKEAVKLVNRIDGRCADRYVKAFCRYIDISEKRFWEIADSHRNPDIWEKDASGNWKRKYLVH